MILFNKGRHKFNGKLSRVKKTPKSVYILIVLILLAIPLYYRLVTMPEPTFEDQMIKYSKYVEVPTLKIDIKFKDYQNLLYQRRQALRSGGVESYFNLEKEMTDVPAKFIYEGKEYKADVKLKGLRKYHFADSTRMSFRCELKGSETLFGMSKFSLHDPKMRNYIYEWMFHELLRKEGFIALKYNFVNIKLNGIESGVYAIEEHFDKILLERYGYVEGPIFKLMDDADSFFDQSIEPFNGKKYNSEEFRNITNAADKKIKAFFGKNFAVSEIINSDMLAKYFALCDVFQFYHGELVKSLRLYYNPLTEKFEPIGFDGHYDDSSPNYLSSEILQRLNLTIQNFYMIPKFQELLFYDETIKDEYFLTQYVKYLKIFSSPQFIDEFFAGIADEFTQKLAIIYKNQPLLKDKISSFGPEEFKFSKEHIYNQALYVRNLLKFDKNLSKSRTSSLIKKKSVNGDNFELLFSNNYSFSIVLNDVVINDSLKYTSEGGNFIMPARYFNVKDFKRVQYKGVDRVPKEIRNIKLSFCIAGTDSILVTDVDLIDEEQNVREDFTANMNGNYTIDEEYRTIKFNHGRHNINKPIILKSGYKVIIESGTELNFTDSAFLLSYSHLLIKGTAEKPVKITSDKTGGIAVFDCDSISYLNNVIFDKLSNPHNKEWKLTGAVTFYKSPVMMENCELMNNGSEDYLNVKHTKFKITNCRFENIYSDAFDSDFCEGRIVNSEFNTMGNDAIDVSGSKVRCINNLILKAGDKAYSSGEGSILTIEKTLIKHTEIAFASKDNSRIEGSEIEISDSRLAFVAYQKKSEYGPGLIELKNVKQERVEKEMLTEVGSTITVNGIRYIGDIEEVSDEYLYGKEFGKKSER